MIKSNDIPSNIINPYEGADGLIIRPTGSLTKHFDWDEKNIACPCCNMIVVCSTLYDHMSRLETMRERLGFAIIVNSGYRCLVHNFAVGGTQPNPTTGKPGSWHLQFATDVRAADFDPDKLTRMYFMAKDLGFNGIGRCDGDSDPTECFLHLDIRPTKYSWRK